MADSRDEWMVVGRVARPFGVRGEMKVDPLTDFPERFDAIRRLFVGPRHDAYAVERSRRQGDHIILKLRGIETPEQVKSLALSDVYVPRSEAVVLPEGHYFLDDIIDMSVVTPDGTSVGTVTDVLRTGSNDVFVINQGRDAVLVPAIKDVVTEIDAEARRVVIEPWVLESDE